MQIPLRNKIVKSCLFALLIKPGKVESDLIYFSKPYLDFTPLKIYDNPDWK